MELRVRAGCRLSGQQKCLSVSERANDSQEQLSAARLINEVSLVVLVQSPSQAVDRPLRGRRHEYLTNPCTSPAWRHYDQAPERLTELSNTPHRGQEGVALPFREREPATQMTETCLAAKS